MSKTAEHDDEGIEHVEAELKAAWNDGWEAIVPSALTPDATSNRNGIYVPLYQVEKRLSAVAEEKDTIPTPPVIAEAMRDARRWRAFIGCARIRVLGTAGFSRDQGDYRHMGLEIYSQNPERGHDNKNTAQWLTEFADCAERENQRTSGPERTR